MCYLNLILISLICIIHIYTTDHQVAPQSTWPKGGTQQVILVKRSVSSPCFVYKKSCCYININQMWVKHQICFQRLVKYFRDRLRSRDWRKIDVSRTSAWSVFCYTSIYTFLKIHCCSWEKLVPGISDAKPEQATERVDNAQYCTVIT